MITYGRNSVGTFPITFKGVFQDVIANKRWFRTNSGTTDYVQLASPVVLDGDFEVEWTGQIPTQGGYVFCNSTHSNNRIAWTSGAGFLLTINNAEVHNTIIPAVAAMRGDGKLHRFVLSRTGTALTLTVDGVGYPVGASAASFVIDRLMSKWNAATIIPNYAGVMFDIRIKSDATLIHHWPMSEGSGPTHVDVIGGNHGTIINGQPSDWELFERLPASGEWVGRELAVPPMNVGAGWTDLGGGEYSANGSLAPYSSLVFGGSTGAGVCRCKYTVVSMTSPTGVAFNLGAGDMWDFTLRAPDYERNQILPYTASYLPRLKPTNLSVFTIRNISIRRILEVANA